jgi:putative ATP-dependent endonuclease of the OLD family
MYLSKLTVKGFRRVGEAVVSFRPGLNIVVGENNAGKTAIVDALRALLGTTEDGTLRLDESDLHAPPGGPRATEIEFRYVFLDLTLAEEADFSVALKATATAGVHEAHFGIKYLVSSTGRLRPRRWCGDHEENSMTSEMLEDLRAVYLQPLRDPASGLRPSRTSQLARLLSRLATTTEKDGIVELMQRFEEELEKQEPVKNTQGAIERQQEDMLGAELKQQLSVGLTATDFQRIAARLQIEVDSFDVEQNGLGYNNLLYMAVVLSDLETNAEVAYRALIVEEPEAHLHPQLQGVLLQFLESKETPVPGHAPVQLFVTSHSPHFASIAPLDSICCVHRAPSGIKAFSPRSVSFSPSSKKDKLQRYLDVTRAELFFARRVIFVEGTAELFLVNALAEKAGYDLKKRSVSLLSTEGLNFDCFLPLFGEDALNIRVALLTDADPSVIKFPQLTDALELSGTAKGLEAAKSKWVAPFFAQKTLEYDIALQAANHAVMLAALKDIHPTIGKELEAKVMSAHEDERAKLIFCGLFERDEGAAVQKGRYSQALAAAIAEDAATVEVPPYIRAALDYIVGP